MSLDPATAPLTLPVFVWLEVAVAQIEQEPGTDATVVVFHQARCKPWILIIARCPQRRRWPRVSQEGA